MQHHLWYGASSQAQRRDPDHHHRDGLQGGLAIPSNGHDRYPFTFELIRPPDRRSRHHSILLESGPERLVLAHRIFPSKPFTYNGEEVIGDGYLAVWFVFQGLPYDIGRFYRPDGSFTGYYVDVLEPVGWTGSTPLQLEPLIDLFLDLWVAPDGNYQVLDEDEFAAAESAGSITLSQARHARAVLSYLVDRVQSGDFPPEDIRDYSSDLFDDTNLTL